VPSAALAPAIRSPAILQLVRIERQTHDFVTLRFRVTEPGTFRPRPGQFLTFDWLIDGQKLVRSYSICSSPTQAGFVEITVKKEPQGRVSTFLNQRARHALTVEARGPYGRFCFDEKEHTRIVLIAGGSGITPIMSMLRYIDDLCLNTSVVLFYCVRSRRDFAFDRELEELEERLTNFKRVPILTSPDSNWTGRSGRISRELLLADIDEVTTRDFFLCGPEGFMNHVGEVLLSLGVDQSRILREKFGGKRATPQNEGEREPEVQGIRIDFAKSGKSSIAVAGRTILETAELSGVDIPSSCRQGQCGTCAVRLLEGNVDMICEEGLDPMLKAQGYVLTCVARAKNDVRLDA
jgi:ferredoxin-NADP reductase